MATLMKAAAAQALPSSFSSQMRMSYSIPCVSALRSKLVLLQDVGDRHLCRHHYSLWRP